MTRTDFDTANEKQVEDVSLSSASGVLLSNTRLTTTLAGSSKVGTFVSLGTDAFTGGSDNSEARVNGNQIQVDANGDGVTDVTIKLTGLTSASQISASDFVWI